MVAQRSWWSKRTLSSFTCIAPPPMPMSRPRT
jgi:hypothetical protein